MSVAPDALDKLAAVLDELVETDPAALADGDTVVALNRQLERLGAVNTRVTAAFDASRRWQSDGARTAAAWLGARCLLPMPTARQRVRLAERCATFRWPTRRGWSVRWERPRWA